MQFDAHRESIAQDLVMSRRRVAAALAMLRTALQEQKDWRYWIARQPEKTLGVAFGFGFLVGIIGTQKRRRRRGR